jgi:hypothetical protein
LWEEIEFQEEKKNLRLGSIWDGADSVLLPLTCDGFSVLEV